MRIEETEENSEDRCCIIGTYNWIDWLPSFTLILLILRLIITRSSHQRCSVKKDVLKNFAKLHREAPVLESLFGNFGGPQPCNFFKKRLQHRSFPVKFAKFLEHLFWRTSGKDCFSITFFQFCSECESIIFDVVCWASVHLWKNNTKMEKDYEKAQENLSKKT